jgi:hypothetical protein
MIDVKNHSIPDILNLHGVDTLSFEDEAGRITAHVAFERGGREFTALIRNQAAQDFIVKRDKGLPDYLMEDQNAWVMGETAFRRPEVIAHALLKGLPEQTLLTFATEQLPID